MSLKLFLKIKDINKEKLIYDFFDEGIVIYVSLKYFNNHYYHLIIEVEAYDSSFIIFTFKFLVDMVKVAHAKTMYKVLNAVLDFEKFERSLDMVFFHDDDDTHPVCLGKIVKDAIYEILRRYKLSEF